MTRLTTNALLTVLRVRSAVRSIADVAYIHVNCPAGVKVAGIFTLHNVFGEARSSVSKGVQEIIGKKKLTQSVMSCVGVM